MAVPHSSPNKQNTLHPHNFTTIVKSCHSGLDTSHSYDMEVLPNNNTPITVSPAFFSNCHSINGVGLVQSRMEGL